MTSAIENYLRTHRKRSGLSQEDVAFLLGLKSGQIISRYERLDRVPSLQTAFACQVLFGTPPHELYPGLYGKVEKITRRRIRVFMSRIGEDMEDASVTHKHATLLQVVERTGSRRPRI